MDRSLQTPVADPRILVIGDTYYPSSVFETALGDAGVLAPVVRCVDIEATAGAPEPDDALLHEYAGSSSQTIELLRDEQILVVHGAAVSRAVLEAAPTLRLVCCGRGGPVNVDLAAAAEHGVTVVSTPGKNAAAVAELTLAFALMLSRHVADSSGSLLRTGSLGGSAFAGAQWFGRELQGARIGLVGCGRVGHAVAERALALGMSVSVHDPYVHDDQLPRGSERATFEGLLAGCAFVSAHVRATPETENLFDAHAFGLMSDHAFFINTARETLVDEEALERAVRGKAIAGAAVDVLRHRPAGDRSPLLDIQGVIATPHIGGATAETLSRGASMIAADVVRWLRGEPLAYATIPMASA